MMEISIDSQPWPESIPEMKYIDDLLRCGICYELMTTCVVTPCSHVYCSMCIRQYLSYKTQCPKCFQNTTDQQLRTNRVLDEIINLIPTLKKKLLVLLSNKELDHSVKQSLDKISKFNTPKPNGSLRKNDSNEVSKPDLLSPESNVKLKLNASISHNISDMSSPAKLNTSVSSQNTPKKISSPNPFKILFSPEKKNTSLYTSPVKFTYSQSTPSSSQMKPTQSKMSAFFSKDKDASAISSGKQSTLTSFVSSPATQREVKNFVSCPVCMVEVPQTSINRHLDDCLNRSEKEKNNTIELPVVKRKPLPKLVYNLLSDKVLKSKMREAGLSTLGEKQDLISRHKRYTLLYNAECDKVNPRPIQDILNQLEQEERSSVSSQSSKTIFNYDRKSDPKLIEKEQVNYVKKNESHFAKLIADVRNRKNASRSKNFNHINKETTISNGVAEASDSINKIKSNGITDDKLPSYKNHSNGLCNGSNKNSMDNQKLTHPTIDELWDDDGDFLSDIDFASADERPVPKKLPSPTKLNSSKSHSEDKINISTQNQKYNVSNTDSDRSSSVNYPIKTINDENVANVLKSSDSNVIKSTIENKSSISNKEEVEENNDNCLSPDMFESSSNHSDNSISLLCDLIEEEPNDVQINSPLSEEYDNLEPIVHGLKPPTPDLQSIEKEPLVSPLIQRRITRSRASFKKIDSVSKDIFKSETETQIIDSCGLDPDYEPSQEIDHDGDTESIIKKRKSQKQNNVSKKRKTRK